MTPAGPTPAPLTLEAMLRTLPKVELHARLFGTVLHETFEHLNQRAGAPLAASEIESFYTRSEKPVGVLRVLRALDAPLVRCADDLYQITLQYPPHPAAQTPPESRQAAPPPTVPPAVFSCTPPGAVHASCIAYPMAQAAIVRAIRDAQQDFGITGRLIAAIDREASPEAAVEMVGWVNANRCDEVIGIGIDYRENDRPPELFMQAYAEAKRAGLKTTAHAGEFGMPWTYVRSALDMLKGDRIDHGYTVVDRPEFARECAERGVLFTVAPTTSYYLGTLPPERWALDHPIRRMPGLGLRIHPNTDDPRLHEVTPTQAWLMMVRDFGFGLDDLRGFMHNGLDGAWIDDTQRRAWRAQWSDAFDTLRARLPTASLPGTQGGTPP